MVNGCMHHATVWTQATLGHPQRRTDRSHFKHSVCFQIPSRHVFGGGHSRTRPIPSDESRLWVSRSRAARRMVRTQANPCRPRRAARPQRRGGRRRSRRGEGRRRRARKHTFSDRARPGSVRRPRSSGFSKLSGPLSCTQFHEHRGLRGGETGALPTRIPQSDLLAVPARRRRTFNVPLFVTPPEASLALRVSARLGGSAQFEDLSRELRASGSRQTGQEDADAAVGWSDEAPSSARAFSSWPPRAVERSARSWGSRRRRCCCEHAGSQTSGMRATPKANPRTAAARDRGDEGQAKRRRAAACKKHKLTTATTIMYPRRPDPDATAPPASRRRRGPRRSRGPRSSATAGPTARAASRRPWERAARGPRTRANP